MFVPPPSSSSARSSSRSRLALASVACLAVLTPLLLTGCNRASAGTTTTAASAQAIEAAREQLNLIPPPSKSRYMAVHNLSTWENPYLTVQENMATLHVTLADANPTDLGAGDMLRPVGARRQDLTIRLSDLPAALDAVPESSWPYGRVIAVEEAHDTPPADRPAVRRNVEAAIKTLGDLGVVVYEWSDGSFR
jgi:type II secretory pathway component PulL